MGCSPRQNSFEADRTIELSQAFPPPLRICPYCSPAFICQCIGCASERETLVPCFGITGRYLYCRTLGEPSDGRSLVPRSASCLHKEHVNSPLAHLSSGPSSWKHEAKASRSRTSEPHSRRRKTRSAQPSESDRSHLECDKRHKSPPSPFFHSYEQALLPRSFPDQHPCSPPHSSNAQH